MREIKFRVRSKETGIIINPVEYDGLFTFHCGIIDGDGFDINALYILEQYTGQLDKNAKKIFEGDIVLYCNNERRIVFDCGSWGIQAIDINFCEGQWIGRHASLYLNQMECEVIGNIHDPS